MAKNEKEQIAAGTVTVRRVEIRITKSLNNGGSKVNACLIRAIFHGNVDGVEYASGQGGTTNGTNYTLDEGLTRTGAAFSGLPFETLTPAAAGGDKGVFEAAKEKEFYTSGQDVDLTSPDNPWIVTSQIKDTYATMQYLLDQYYSDKWTTEDESLGVAEGAIGAVFVTHESENPRNEKLTDEDVATLKETAEKIKNKEIDLSVVPEEESYNQ